MLIKWIPFNQQCTTLRYTYNNSKLNSHIEYSKCCVTILCTNDIYNIILSAMFFHLHHHQYPGEVMLELPSWEEALGILWLIFLRYMGIPVVQARKKKHEFQLSLWKSSSQILLALSVSFCSFNDLDGRWLAWSLVYWASGNEKRLAQKQNLLVQDNWTAFFSSPVVYNKFITLRYTCL